MGNLDCMTYVKHFILHRIPYLAQNTLLAKMLAAKNPPHLAAIVLANLLSVKSLRLRESIASTAPPLYVLVEKILAGRIEWLENYLDNFGGDELAEHFDIGSQPSSGPACV